MVVAGCAIAVGASAPPEEPPTYVALGASDAVGIGAVEPEREGWVPQLGALLGPTVRTVNLGVSGSTLSQALREQVGPAIDASPDVITIWLVVNDINARVPLEAYAADLDRMLAQLQPTGARILLGNVPDLSQVAVYQQAGIPPEAMRAEVERWNAVIAAAADRYQAELVDLFSQWRELADHPEYISGDGFHPSAEGYQRMAELFYAQYQRQPRTS